MAWVVTPSASCRARAALRRKLPIGLWRFVTTDREFADFFALSQIMPGPNFIFVLSLIGCTHV